LMGINIVNLNPNSWYNSFTNGYLWLYFIWSKKWQRG
jgi:hypothetical protein